MKILDMIYIDFRTHPDLPWILYFYIPIKAGIISKLYRKRWSGTFLRIHNAMVHLRSSEMIKGSLQTRTTFWFQQGLDSYFLFSIECCSPSDNCSWWVQSTPDPSLMSPLARDIRLASHVVSKMFLLFIREISCEKPCVFPRNF